MLRIEHHPNGPRVYVLGLRLHHGLTAAVVVVGALATHHHAIAALAGVAMIEDLHDFPWRLREQCPHEHQSGQLKRTALARCYGRSLVCDDCGQEVCELSREHVPAAVSP